MTKIEATCGTCGTVERTAEDFELAVSDRPGASWYAFVCPECDQRIQKHADERVIELLISEGVKPFRVRFPEEALESHEGPAFTLDDVLDLHMMLQRNDWFESLLQQT